MAGTKPGFGQNAGSVERSALKPDAKRPSFASKGRALPVVINTSCACTCRVRQVHFSFDTSAYHLLCQATLR